MDLQKNHSYSGPKLYNYFATEIQNIYSVKLFKN